MTGKGPRGCKCRVRVEQGLELFQVAGSDRGYRGVKFSVHLLGSLSPRCCAVDSWSFCRTGFNDYLCLPGEQRSLKWQASYCVILKKERHAGISPSM